MLYRNRKTISVLKIHSVAANHENIRNENWPNSETKATKNLKSTKQGIELINSPAKPIRSEINFIETSASIN